MRLTREPDTIIGVDFGKRRDYTAIAILEHSIWVTDVRDPVSYEWRKKTFVVVRDTFRLPLGTPYPDIVEALKRIARSFEQRHRLVVDATGLGIPVTDQLKRAALCCPVEPISITTGDRVSSDGHGGFNVPKQHLVAALEDAIHRGRLEISKHAREAEALIQELQSFQARTTSSGRETYSGEPHDDLVMATALANWRIGKLWP